MPKKSRSRESAANRRQRAALILTRLKHEFPAAKTALHHSNPLQLLLATILSAQCTDERVNIVSTELFATYHTATDFAKADQQEVEQIIRSTGFFRAKAKSIINCCKELVAKHNGKVPDSMELLVQLPGVGRKTANVVLSNAFGKAEGIVVDTHVKRLAGRLGFSKQSDPEKIEQELMDLIPRIDWIATGDVLILHGRKTCHARKPKCPECIVNDLCPSAKAFIAATR